MTVARALANSFCFGVYDGSRQMGLTRVITDWATYAYLTDVYILGKYRGQNLAKWSIGTIIAHPELQGLRSWHLSTRDAHGLYAQFDFASSSPLAGHMMRQVFAG